MSSSVSKAFIGCKPAVASDERPKPRPNPRRRSTPLLHESHEDRQQHAMQIRRDSRLNTQGHAILSAARQLMIAIDHLTDGDAESELFEELEAEDYDGMLIGQLIEVEGHCHTLRGVVQLYAEVVKSLLIPTSEMAEAGKRVPR